MPGLHSAVTLHRSVFFFLQATNELSKSFDQPNKEIQVSAEENKEIRVSAEGDTGICRRNISSVLIQETKKSEGITENCKRRFL
jgi:uncharacterized protein YajQ (UPF0234 family)